jgi:hypothetical protein
MLTREKVADIGISPVEIVIRMSSDTLGLNSEKFPLKGPRADYYRCLY